MLEYEQLTPEQAGSSVLALQISRKILQQPAMLSVRRELSENDNLSTFCGYLAREVIDPILTRWWEE